MPDAGSIWYHALSHTGEEIGSAIGKNIQYYQKQKTDIARDMAVLERLSKMPDPTDPTGKKMLVDQRKMIALQHLKGSQLQAAAEGEIQAIELGQKIHKSSEPIRNLMHGPVTRTDESGRQWRFSGKEWIPMTAQKSQAQDQSKQQRAFDQRLKTLGLNRVSLFDSSRHEGGIMGKPDPKSPIKKFIPESDYSKSTHIRVGFQDEKNPGVTIPKTDFESLQESAAQQTDDPEWTLGAVQWIRDNQKDPRAAKWLEVVRRKIIGGVAPEESPAPSEATNESPNGSE